MILQENVVLDYYISRMDDDKISFLRDKKEVQGTVRTLIEKLKSQREMHDRIETAKELWKLLFEASMSYIDGDKRGFDQIFKFFDKYVEFEELIFASDSFYRDHTLHCLWVYFLGEYIKNKDEFQVLVSDFEERDDTTVTCKSMQSQLEKLSVSEVENVSAIKDLRILINDMLSSNEFQEAERCMCALTHDLGYPLKKIAKINKSINGVLNFFDIKDSDEYNFKYSDVQQNYIEELIRTISMEPKMVIDFGTDEVRVNHPEIYKTMMEKMEKTSKENNGRIYKVFDMFNYEESKIFFSYMKIDAHLLKQTETELGYFYDFELFNHGIMSAYLLSKTIKSFTSIGVQHSRRNDIDLKKLNKDNFMIKRNILKAISDHTSDNYQISNIENGSDFLILMDELEEFSRISRAEKNRQFVDEFCKSEIFMEEGVMNSNFIFDNEELANIDPEFVFKGRCRRFLKLFRISELNEKLKFKFRCIGKLEHDDNTYELHIERKFAKISINGEEKCIPKYLKSNEFYTREEYSEQ